MKPLDQRGASYAIAKVMEMHGKVRGERESGVAYL
jgi:hypothetical protein